MKNRHLLRNAALSTLVVASSLAMTGCDDDNDTMPAMRSYLINIQNMTENQPLSPAALIVHNDQYSGWALGSSASQGLEILAEGGDNSTFLSEANNAQYTMSGQGLIVPGDSESLHLEFNAFSDIQLTLATMLVNSNDAFAGLKALSLDELEIGESLTTNLSLYDAGTEANDEYAAHIPGPAGGGEGFNAARNDKDIVAMHPGFVTMDDGYTDSALTAAHKVDNPVARVMITRQK